MIRTGEGLVWEHVEPIIHHQIDVDTIHDDEDEKRIGAQRYHFAKHGADLGVIEICNDHDCRSRQFFKLFQLRFNRSVGIAGCRGRVGAKCGGCCITDHRRQFRKIRMDSCIQKATVSRPYVK